jgi:DNA polymerase III subunit epsilon
MKLNLSRPLAVFDIETTGVNVGSDRIIEICILKVNPDGTEEVKTLRINPGIPIPKEASDIHGIYNKDVKDCPGFKEVAPDLAQFLKNCDLGGYNSNKFDIPLLVEEFYRAKVDFEIANRRFVDVQNIFHKMEPRTLKAAYKFYCGKDIINAHSAEADTRATYEVLLSQIEKYDGVKYEDNKGKTSIPVVNDVQALHEFSVNNRNADLVGHVVFDENGVEVFNFGKYKGKSVAEVFQKEPQYYDWMKKADFPLSTKNLLDVIKLRGFNNSSVNIKKL